MSIIQFLYLIIFKTFGLAPFTVEYKNKYIIAIKYSWIDRCYNILLIIITLILNYFIIPEFYKKSNNENVLSQRIEIFLTIAVVSIVIVVWICYCVKQSTMVSVANDLISFDNSMLQLTDFYYLENNNFLIHLLLLLYGILAFSSIYAHTLTSKEFTKGIYILLNVSIGLHILQYGLILAIIKKRFACINRAMIKIFETHNDYGLNKIIVRSNRISENPIHEKIMILRRGHRSLANICSRVSALYGTSILFSITYTSGLIVYYMYTVINPFVHELIDNESKILILDELLLLIAEIIVIIALTVYASGVMDEMGMITDGINKLINVRMANREVNLELRQFAIEMLHRKVCFDACGIFVIDCSLLRSITSMTTTYLILLVQQP